MFDILFKIQEVHFANIYLLLLLFIIPVLIVWYWFKHSKRSADIQLSTTQVFKDTPKSIKQKLYHALFVLRMLIFAFIIIALARPQTSTSRQELSIEGIDIVMTIDVSTSMLAMDFKPNRLEAAKVVAMDFIDGRKNDRIGLVVFSGVSFTQCPITSDYSVLKGVFELVKTGMIEDGTAIGSGLGTAIDRIKDSKAVSKVIILLTDGVNNKGEIDPVSAAEIAKIFNVRIYTIGVGTRGMAPYPFQTPFGKQVQNVKVDIDEDILMQVADITNGKYFRATNREKLEEIYKEIDIMEKTKIDVSEYRKKKEEFLLFIVLAVSLFTLEIICRNTIFKTVL